MGLPSIFSFGQDQEADALPKPFAFTPPPSSITPEDNFNASPVGHVVNFVQDFFQKASDPTFTIPAAYHALKSFGQGVLQTATSVANSIGELANPNGNFASAPVPAPLQGIYGTDKIKTAGEQLLDLQDSIKQNPLAQQYGLDKHAPAVAFFGVLGDEVLNTLGIGWGEESNFIKTLAKEVDPAVIGNLLRGHGVHPDVADQFAPAIADTANEADIKGLLGAIKGTQNAATIAEHGGENATTGLDDVMHNPTAQQDWETTYADQYAQLGDQISELDTAAKEAKGPEKAMLADRATALTKKQVDMEEKWLGKWGTPGGLHEGPPPTEAELANPQPVAEDNSTSVAETYWDDLVAPKLAEGKGISIGGDDLKDYFGKDYNDVNHPTYSKAAFSMYERALAESKGDTVVLTGGGPGSGKTEILTKGLLDRGFDGIIYDSNLSNYEGAVKQIQMARDAGKDVVVAGIIPNLARARFFTLLRESESGRAISDATFARGHAGFPETLRKLLANGILQPEDVRLIDAQGKLSLEDAKAMVGAGDFHKDPLALLDKARYNEEELRQKYGRERFTTQEIGKGATGRVPEITGARESAVPASSQDRPNTGGANDGRGTGPALRDNAGSPALTETQSLELAADSTNEWRYALRGNTTEEDSTINDLTRVFADLHGVSIGDLKGGFSAEDLDNAKAQYEIAKDAMLDHPGRALMRYVSRESGDLPELRGRTGPRVGKGGKQLKDNRGAFNKAGDDIVQDLIGQNETKGGDVVVAQEMVDDYRNLREGVLQYEQNVKDIRKSIRLEKSKDKFVESAQHALASKFVKDTKALANLVRAGERAGITEGKAAGKKAIADMIAKLKGRRLEINRVQQRTGLSDRQFARIIGRQDPRFMTDDQFHKYLGQLYDNAAGLRASTDRYGVLDTPAMTLNEQMDADKGSWRYMIKGYYNKLPEGRQKADWLDYLGTPEYVLERLGLGKAGEMLHDAQDAARTTTKAELGKVIQWKVDAGNRPQASTRIFRWLDGREREVAPEMSPQELKVAKEIRAYLQEWADRLHLPADSRLSKYITHLFEREGSVVKEGEDIFDDPELATLMADKPAGSVYDPFLQQRLGKRGYKEDVWAALDAYTKRASRKEAYDPVLDQITEAAKNLNEDTYKYVSDLTHRINMRPTELDKMIDNFIKYRVGIKKLGPRPLAFVSQKLRAGFYRGLLGLNFSSALRNLSQGANTYAKLGEKYTVLGYSKLLVKMLSNDLGELHDMGILDDALIQDRRLGVYQSLMEKLDPVLFSMFDMAEKINRGSAYYGAKARYLDKNTRVVGGQQIFKEGATMEDAQKYAKRIVRETQFAFGAVDMPVGLAGDITKTFSQLQNYNLKQVEFLGRMVKNKEYAGLVRYTVASLAFLFTIGKLFGMTANQLLPSIGVGGAPTLTALAAFGNLFSNNQQDRTDAQKQLGTAVISRIPAGMQIRKTLQGIATVQQGGDKTATGKFKYHVDPSVAKYLQAGFFGKSALPEAQAYFDKVNNPKAKTPGDSSLPPSF